MKEPLNPCADKQSEGGVRLVSARMDCLTACLL